MENVASLTVGKYRQVLNEMIKVVKVGDKYSIAKQVKVL